MRTVQRRCLGKDIGGGMNDKQISKVFSMQANSQLSELTNIVRAPIEYGVRWAVGASSPTGERIKKQGDSIVYGTNTGLTAEMPVDNAAYINHFDMIFRNSKVQDASGNYFSRFDKFYVKYTLDASYFTVMMCYSKLDGYIPAQCFVNADGTEADYVDIGCYEGYLNGTKLESKPGLFPTTEKTISNFRIYSAANGSGYRQGDIRDVQLKQVLMTIEFATRNLQAITQGAASMAYSNDHKALLTESAVNRIVITTAQAAGFVVGQTINIGTGTGNYSVARNRIVQSISAVDGSNSEIVFDGAAVNIAANNVVSSASWKTGSTDSILSPSGNKTANAGKHPFKWRYIENPYANIWEFIDGVGVVQTADESTATVLKEAYVCTEPTKYADITYTGGLSGAANIPSGYEAISYDNALAEGYVKDLGFDVSKPFCRFPTVTSGGSSTTYYCDYYYTSNNNVANKVETRVVLFGGRWSYGSYCGPFFLDCYNAFSVALVNIGSRLSKDPS